MYNYGIILMGNRQIFIDGKVTHWEIMNDGTANVTIDGVLYKTGVNNLLLMYKEEEES